MVGEPVLLVPCVLRTVQGLCCIEGWELEGSMRAPCTSCLQPPCHHCFPPALILPPLPSCSCQLRMLGKHNPGV